jgi:hypothetical protein
MTPETFMSVGLQRVFAGGVVGFGGGRRGRLVLRRWLGLGSGTLLRENWHRQNYDQQ